MAEKIRLESLEDIQFYIIDLIDRCGDKKEHEKGKRSLLRIWQNAERMRCPLPPSLAEEPKSRGVNG